MKNKKNNNNLEKGELQLKDLLCCVCNQSDQSRWGEVITSFPAANALQ